MCYVAPIFPKGVAVRLLEFEHESVVFKDHCRKSERWFLRDPSPRLHGRGR
jgi:hypothetical protein